MNNIVQNIIEETNFANHKNKEVVHYLISEILILIPEKKRNNLSLDTDLLGTIKIDPEEIEEVVERLFEKFNLELPSVEVQSRFFENKNITTLRLLIDFVSHYSEIRHL
jgi:hypothetical protein